MTMLMVNEGIYRAARRTGRGRRKRRGEFVPVDSLASCTLPSLSGVSSVPTGRTTSALQSETTPVPAGMAELRVSEEHDASGRVALRMRGTLDLATVLPFRDAVFTAIGKRPTSLLLDLTRVENVDIAGISTLVTVGRVARLLHVSFFVAPSASLRATLESTGISRTLALAARDGVQ